MIEIEDINRLTAQFGLDYYKVMEAFKMTDKEIEQFKEDHDIEDDKVAIYQGGLVEVIGKTEKEAVIDHRNSIKIVDIKLIEMIKEEVK